jgi:hypothetical protein
MRTLFAGFSRRLVAVILASLTAGALGGAAYVRDTDALAVTARVSGAFSGTESTSLDQGTVSFPAALSYTQTFTSGTGNNAADRLWCDTRTSADADPDLAGTLTGALGTVTFATVKTIFITAPTANTGNLLVGGAGGSDFVNWVGDASDVIVVKPGGYFALSVGGTGYAVTAGTGDILGIAASAGTATYSICVLGTSA